MLTSVKLTLADSRSWETSVNDLPVTDLLDYFMGKKFDPTGSEVRENFSPCVKMEYKGSVYTLSPDRKTITVKHPNWEGKFAACSLLGERR